MCVYKSMDKKREQERSERREELLRPSRYLGYDRDELGMYLLSRGAYEIAETQLRRAVWLNPFEYRFVLHLAWCLYKQGLQKQAQECVSKIDNADVEDDKDAQKIIALIMKS